jgi:cytochrome c oxidase cbb3-type subunit III
MNDKSTLRHALAALLATALLSSHATTIAQVTEPFESPIPAMAQEDLEIGKNVFQVHCARCHGMLGEGGEGPSLKRPRLVHAQDDRALYSVISRGIPGTGMPATWVPRPRDLWRVAAYVQSLGRLADEELPGDPTACRVVYESKGNCSCCHILGGTGCGVGPELSEVGLRRNREYLQRALISPEMDQPKIASQMRGTLNSFLTVRVVSELGTYEGMRINENEFSVQMRDLSGNIYSFDKAKLTSYEKDFGHLLMPGYGAVLGEADVNHLVAYLMSLKGEN